GLDPGAQTSLRAAALPGVRARHWIPPARERRLLEPAGQPDGPQDLRGSHQAGSPRARRLRRGYLTAIKLREDDDFENMAEAAGVTNGKDRGLLLTRLSMEPVAGLILYFANYLVADVLDTMYGFAEYAHELTPDLSYKIGLQLT